MLENLTCHDLIAGMPTVFNTHAAGDLNGDIQFHMTGEEPGEYYLSIANGTCTFNEGTSPHPKMTINSPSEVWTAIGRNEIDGQLAFMQGKYTVSGDFGILMKLGALFKST
jgi:putative sterol carrier protein